jgi:GST-like protein
MWQMGGLGPMSGQAHHFRNYASEKIPYAIDRYTNEVNRLYGVLDRQLARHDYIAGDYSIADMATFPWVLGYENLGQKIEDFPHMGAWIARMKARPAVARGIEVGKELRTAQGMDEEAKKVLFGQTAATTKGR